MPGRFFAQKFLRQAVNAKCDWAIIEMTSEGAKQFRHKFIDLDALIFTNLAPEHIESHGSYEKYLAAKLSIAGQLEKSRKRPRSIIANTDDKEGGKFLAINVEKKLSYSLFSNSHELKNSGGQFIWKGEKIKLKPVGEFNKSNALAAATFADSIGIKPSVIKTALQKIEKVPGRVEFINESQPFEVVVDYAHTPDSLRALYEAFKQGPSTRYSRSGQKRKLVCVLGNTGGGRDKWKRPEMGAMADKYCDKIILTNEDPYDENPREILADMEKGFTNHKPEIILDRREAIEKALQLATDDSRGLAEGGYQNNSVVLITGKGTDPFIMEAGGKKTPWSDEKVVREELRKIR